MSAELCGSGSIVEQEHEAGGDPSAFEMASQMRRGIHRPPTLALLSALHDEVRSMHSSDPHTRCAALQAEGRINRAAAPLTTAV